MRCFYLTAAVLAIVLGYCSAQKCHSREIDLCMVSMASYIREPAKAVPINDEETDKICVVLKEIVGCAQNFSRSCLTPIHRELVDLIIQNPLKVLDDFCTAGSELRRDFLKHAPCLREVAGSSEIRQCVSDVQATLDLLTNVPEDPFALGCCAYSRLRICAESQVESKCGKEAIEFGDLLMKTALANIPNRVCGCMDPEGSECSNLLPPPGTKPLGTKSKSALARLVATFLPPAN